MESDWCEMIKLGVAPSFFRIPTSFLGDSLGLPSLPRIVLSFWRQIWGDIRAILLQLGAKGFLKSSILRYIRSSTNKFWVC